MAEIFALTPDDERRVHPYALERLKRLKADTAREVSQVSQVSMEDLDRDAKRYLSNEEKLIFSKCQEKIEAWLFKCADIKDGHSSYPYATDIIDPMFDIKRLLKKVYERKEEENRRHTALKALNPPWIDAETFLNADEYQRFKKSISGAIDAYLKHSRADNLDSGSFDYRWLCGRIKIRLEERELKAHCKRKSLEYNRSLIKEIEELKSSLYPKKQSIREYFEKQAADSRYSSHRFTDLLLDKEKQALTNTIDRIVRRKLDDLVPGDFYDFIDWKYRTYYFLLPSANYSFDVVPCLDFSFDAFAIVEIEVWLKPSQKSFGGYKYTLPLIEHKCDPHASYFRDLKEPEFLGYRYYLFTPSDLGDIFWQRIPLSLVVGFINGEMEPAGAKILEASETEIIYKVNNFKHDIYISSSFANYLKEIGGIDQMSDIGILTNKVANIVKGKLNQLVAEEKASLLVKKRATAGVEMTGKTTKKARAYLLFNEGRGPGSPEVRALGMHKSTRYKYYRQWEFNSRSQ